jgi:hypothetical protein
VTIRILPAEERFHREKPWLSSYYLFSFDEYYDPENVSFGPLRVFNDDLIQPGHGFSPHPHQDMEIVTLILEGRLTHADSVGGGGTLGPGDVQRMTAGAGITHSEVNRGAVPVHLFQIWILPETSGLAPSYEQATVAWRDRPGRLVPAVSGRGIPGTLPIHQEVTLFAALLPPGEEREYDPEGRRVFVYLSQGRLTLNGRPMEGGDQARIEGEDRLSLRSKGASELVLIDLP